jgi:ribosome-associated toxin RatA of RatAB toxin-antitoxin module
VTTPPSVSRPATESAKVSTLVTARPEECYVVAIDIASYPDWAHAISAVEILDLDEQGRVATARFSAEAVGRQAQYVLRYDYSAAPERLSWSQVSGDLTASVDGAYVFSPSLDDPSATHVSYELSIGLVLPLPGFVMRRAEAKIVEAALGKFRRRVEEFSSDLS